MSNCVNSCIGHVKHWAQFQQNDNKLKRDKNTKPNSAKITTKTLSPTRFPSDRKPFGTATYLLLCSPHSSLVFAELCGDSRSSLGALSSYSTHVLGSLGAELCAPARVLAAFHNVSLRSWSCPQVNSRLSLFLLLLHQFSDNKPTATVSQVRLPQEFPDGASRFSLADISQALSAVVADMKWRTISIVAVREYDVERNGSLEWIISGYATVSWLGTGCHLNEKWELRFLSLFTALVLATYEGGPIST